MRAFLPGFVVIVCAALTASAAVDLTPHILTTYTDGIPIRRPYFADGNKKYALALDNETTLTAANGGAHFEFNKFMYAVMDLRPSALSPELAFDAASLPRYREAALQMLPQGNDKVKVEKEEANVMPINGWSSYRFTFSYGFFGQRFCESVTFLNLDAKQQIVMQVSAKEADYQVISSRAWDIIRAWHEVTRDAEKPSN